MSNGKGRPDSGPSHTTTRPKNTARYRVAAIYRHRRDCKAFDRWALDYYGEEACAEYGITPDARRPEPYASGGMDLGYDGRERAR